jgi:hypothetical protein
MILTDTGLADPRAYVRLAAIVRQQIIDGTLERILHEYRHAA